MTVRHVYKSNEQHSTNGWECSCGPLYLVMCNECEGDGCSICDDEGRLPVPKFAAMQLEDEGVVISHNERGVAV